MHQRTLESQRRLRKVGDLASEVAHEIKNPITAILCSAETLDLLIGDEIDEHHRDSLRYIKEYGENVLRLVADFLDLSQAESGKLNAQPEKINVYECACSIVGLLDSSAKEKKIALTCNAVEKNLFAHMDPKHFRQILFNLVHNAVKFTPSGGEVRVLVKSGFPESVIRIAVTDNGCGIGQDHLERLFEPYRSSASQMSPSEGKGAGLGLTLCKALVEFAGGDLRAESTEGLGSSFEFCIPAWEQEEELEEVVETLDPGMQPLVGQRFLIVDEDTGSRESVSRLIEAWGGIADRVALAADAVEALAQYDYDAVMIDDGADGVFGEELASIIKEDQSATETTIIVASRQKLDPELKKHPIADTCLEKPFNGEKLLLSLLKSGKYSSPH